MNESRPRTATGGRPRGLAAGRERWGRISGNVRGGLWVILSAGFFASMLTLVKVLGATLHITQILLFQQAFLLLLAAPAVIRGLPGSVVTARPGVQAIRLVVAAAAMLLSYIAVIHLPLADAVTITFSRTFFITIFAIVILSEAVGARRWLATIIGFGGVLIAAQPEGLGSFNVYGLMAIGGAACFGLIMIIIRILSRTDRPVTIMTYQASGIGLIMLGPAIYYWTPPTLFEWGLLFGLGACTAMSQLCNILGFRAAEASALAPFDYFRFVYAVLIGFLVFSEWPSPQVTAGAMIIVAAGLYTLHRERREARTADALGGPLQGGAQGT